jgi:hypothetical protein
MVPVGQEDLQDRLRPFPPAARPHRVPPLGPVRSPPHKSKAQSQPRYFSHACAHLCSDAPLFIHIQHKQPIRHAADPPAASSHTPRQPPQLRHPVNRRRQPHHLNQPLPNQPLQYPRINLIRLTTPRPANPPLTQRTPPPANSTASNANRIPLAPAHAGSVNAEISPAAGSSPALLSSRRSEAAHVRRPVSRGLVTLVRLASVGVTTGVTTRRSNSLHNTITLRGIARLIRPISAMIAAQSNIFSTQKKSARSVREGGPGPGPDFYCHYPSGSPAAASSWPRAPHLDCPGTDYIQGPRTHFHMPLSPSLRPSSARSCADDSHPLCFPTIVSLTDYPMLSVC